MKGDSSKIKELKGFVKTKSNKKVATVTPDVAQKDEMEGSDEEGKVKGKYHVQRLPININEVDVTWNYKSFRDWIEEKNDIEEIDIDEGDNLDRIARFVAKTIDRLSKNLAAGTKTRIELFEGVR